MTFDTHVTEAVRRLIVMLFLLAAACPAFGQAAASGGAGSEVQDARAKAKARRLLEEGMAQVAGLRDVENRLLLKTAAADALWDFDPSKARALFDEVATEYLARRAAARGKESADGRDLDTLLLREILQTMGRHAPAQALALVRTLEQSSPGPDGEAARTQSQRDLELSLAAQLAGSNPAEAIEAARDSLKSGFSYGLTDVISKLSHSDPSAAAELVRDVETKLLSARPRLGPEAAAVAAGIINLAAEEELRAAGSAPDARRVVKTQTVKSLAERLTADAAASGAADDGLRQRLQSVAAAVQRLAPDSYLQLQRELERHNQTLDATARAYSRFERLAGEADLSVLLAEIPKAPKLARDALYQQAAWKALGDSDVASARRIATELVSDEEGRGQLLSQIERQEVRQAILRGELPEVRQLAPTWQSDEDATAALVELASVLAGRGRKDDALRALGEARALLGEELNNPAQFGAALELAGAYAKLDPEQSFGLMDRLVNRVNEMVAAGAVLNGFVGQRHSYLGGSLFVHVEGGVVNSLFLQCVGGLLPLAHADFERAADLAERFNAPETSASAKVLLAKLYLTETNSTR